MRQVHYRASWPHGFESQMHHCTGCRPDLSRAFFRLDRASVLAIFANYARILLGDHNEAPRSSLLRRSSHFGDEGWKLRGILRNSPTRRPEPLCGVLKPLPSFA